MIYKLTRLLVLVSVISACATQAPKRVPAPAVAVPTAPTPAIVSPEAVFTPGIQGRLSDDRLNEISGLAYSQRLPDRLWAINDSGNRAELYALDTEANLTRFYRLAASNRDWEAMASTTLAGIPYLLIADTGDNLERHDESRIYFFEEPDSNTSTQQPLIPAFTLRFQYPDGSHNVEAMAVSEQQIVLLTKERLQKQTKNQRSRIYQLPINVESIGRKPKPVVAQNVGMLTLPKRGFDIGLLTRVLNIDPLQPTDLAISADSQQAYVLNYVQVLHYERLKQESWADAFAKQPTVFYRHGLRQAEALTVSPAGNLWLTSERVGSPLVAIDGVQSSNASRVSP